jgi:hypothetical protein
MSKMARRMMVLAAIAVMAVGCGDDDGDDGDPVDAGTDMTTPPVDMGGVDMFMEDEDMFVADEDMGPDDDMGPDETDMFVGDGGLPGGGSATSTQIQAVIDATDGDVTLMIDDAIVTYTKIGFDDGGTDDAGFFVQAEQTGPALYVAVDPTSLSPEPAVGDVVDFQVTTKSTSGSVPFAEVIDSWNVDSSGADVTFLVQDVTAVDLVTDIGDYTSELVSVTGATIEDAFSFAGSGFGAAEITTTGVPTQTENFLLRVPNDVRTGSALGVGCTVDVGPSPMWRFDADAQVSAWDPADFTVTACPEPEAGDLVINEVGYQFAGDDEDLEFIELYNPTDDAYDIAGCILADDAGPADADAFTLPAGSIVASGGYFVIAGSASEITGDAVLPTDLGFGGSDAVSLTCTGDVQIDIVDWSTGTFPAMEDVSTQLTPGANADDNDDFGLWCLTPAGNTYGTMDRVGTPGAENLACSCPAASGVIINEVDYQDDSTDNREFVELHNPSGAAIDVSGWVIALVNGSGSTVYSEVTLTGSIPAGGYLVVIGSGSTVTPTVTDGSYEFGSNIQNGPDGVALFDGALDATPTLLDVVVYDGTFADPDITDGGTVIATIPAPLNRSIGSDMDAAEDTEAMPDLNSLARVTDGCDRATPPVDWAFGPATAGAAN